MSQTCDRKSGQKKWERGTNLPGKLVRWTCWEGKRRTPRKHERVWGNSDEKSSGSSRVINVTENTHASHHLSKSWLWYVLHTFLWLIHDDDDDNDSRGCFVVVSTAECMHVNRHSHFVQSQEHIHDWKSRQTWDNNVKSNDISTISIHSIAILTFVVSFSFTFRFLLSLVGMIELSFLLLFPWLNTHCLTKSLLLLTYNWHLTTQPDSRTHTNSHFKLQN